MSDVFLRPFASDSNRLFRVASNIYEICCYALPDEGILQARLDHLLRKCRAETQEYQWFYRVLSEAVHSWESIIDTCRIDYHKRSIGWSSDR